MPLPPVEPGVRGMTRRNYLVECNRLRVARYEPIRKAQEEDDIRIAQQKAAEREAMRTVWLNSTAKRSTEQQRVYPGGNPRSQRRKDTEHQRHFNEYQQEKEMEARKKAEYERIFQREAKKQLLERREVLAKARADEHNQLAALREINEERDRCIAEEARREAEEKKAYMERVRSANAAELAKKAARQREQEEKDMSLMRVVRDNNRLRTEMEELHAKNLTRMMRMENEENHRIASKRSQENKARDATEMALAVERDRRLAKEEQDAQAAKKERFRQEFQDTISREAEFRRTHNYDEPEEVTRQRNEMAAESYRLMRREEQLRLAEHQRSYCDDLLKQIKVKQEYELKHLDEI